MEHSRYLQMEDEGFAHSADSAFNIKRLTKKQRIFILTTIVFLIGVFLVGSIFLIYDHVKYPGTTKTPDNVVTWRNISIISVFVSSILICCGTGYYIYLTHNYEMGIGNYVSIIIGSLVYFASLIFWIVYHVYFTVGGRNPSGGVHITKMIAMMYVIVVTVLLFMIACAQDPTACLIICLLEN